MRHECHHVVDTGAIQIAIIIIIILYVTYVKRPEWRPSL